MKKKVERLFITKEVNPQGIYRVKFCKNGEWITVTVDDFFPCTALGGPIFSRAHGNELWVLLLEKVEFFCFNLIRINRHMQKFMEAIFF